LKGWLGSELSTILKVNFALLIIKMEALVCKCQRHRKKLPVKKLKKPKKRAKTELPVAVEEQDYEIIQIGLD
jgi:hypothetical protein